MKGLTKRQREIVDFISDFIHSHRYSPSYREIMSHFGFSCVGSVSRHIFALKRKGILSNEKSCSRSLLLSNSPPVVSSARKNIELPLIGTVQAGSPIDLFSDSELISVPEALVQGDRGESQYVLRARGDGFEEEMVMDGDLLIVEARQQAEPGETVIALINNHDTIIKKYHPEGVYIRLLGHNPRHHPIILREEDVLIQAVIIGLMRGF